MGAENGPSMESIKSFNGEVLSKSFSLSEQFRKGGVLGEKTDNNERDKANEEARRILNTSFVVGKVAETQIEPIIEFNSVDNMISIANNDKLSDFLRQRAKNALYETGLALSLDKTVFKAATEGVEELDKVIPSNLHGIQPYILSSYLSNGKEDRGGHKLVEELVDVFRLKKRADKDPEYFKKDFEEKAKELFGKLLDKCDEASGEDESNGNVGRWETMMGYIKGIDDRTKREPVLTDKRSNGPIEGQKEAPKKPNRYDVLDEIETDDVEVLTKVAKDSLDYIENLEDFSFRYRLTGQPTDVLDHISMKLSKLISETRKRGDIKNFEKYDLLRKEIESRLTIFDTAKAMRESNFRITERGRGGVGDAIEQCVKSNRIMTPEVLNFCINESKKAGYDMAAALDLIEDANFDYSLILQKVWDSGMVKDLVPDRDDNGRVISEEQRKSTFLRIDKKMSSVEGQEGGLFMDVSFWPQRAKMVEEYIISQLGNNAEKTYQLTQFFIDATGERSNFNFGFINGDTMCEATYFKDFRNDDASKGKNIGPMANRGVYGLMRGWLRDFSDVDHTYDLHKRNGKIKAKDIKPERAIGKKTATMYFGKILSSYVLTTRSALMDSDPDPKKVLNTTWPQELIGSMDKVDIPYDVVKGADGQWREATESDTGERKKSRSGKQDIKTYYVLGLMELFVTKSNIEWDVNLTKDFKKIFVDTILADTGKGFISQAQWNWCLEQKIAHITKNNKVVSSLTFFQAMGFRQKEAFKRSFFDGLASGSVGGKKKRQ